MGLAADGALTEACVLRQHDDRSGVERSWRLARQLTRRDERRRWHY